MSLAGVDGVGDRQVVDHPLLPVLLGPLLPGQAVVEAGQAGALKGGHSQDVLEEDSTAGRREATQRMTCTHRGRVSVCWTCWKSLCWSLYRAAGGRVATQRMTCTRRDTVTKCWTILDLLEIFVLEFVQRCRGP